MKSRCLVTTLILCGIICYYPMEVSAVLPCEGYEVPLTAHSLENLLLNTTWGGRKTDIAFGITQNKGAFYITGVTYSFGNGTPDFPNAFVAKFDMDGNEIWNLSWGGEEADGAYAIASSDDGIFITGYTDSYGNGTPLDSNVFLVKLDPDGNELWNRTYSFNNETAIAQSIAITDQNIYITGRVMRKSFYQAFLLKLDLNGDIIWEKEWGGGYDDAGYTISVLDECILIGGWTNSYGPGIPSEPNAFIVSYNTSGGKQWEDVWGGIYFDTGWSIMGMGDTIYLLGETMSYSPSPGVISNAFVMKYHVNGTKLWEKIYGERREIIPRHITAIDKDNLVFVGGVRTQSSQFDLLLAYVNATSGREIVEISWGGERDDVGFGVIGYQGGIFLTGGTSSFGNGTSDDPDAFLLGMTRVSSPSSPSFLKAYAENEKIILSWGAPVRDGGLPIYGYRIYRGTVSGGESFFLEVGNVNNYTDTDVIIGQTYYYQVSAVNMVGEGPPSNEVNVTFSPIPNPNKPPRAEFLFSPLSPTTEEIVQFTDLSSDPDGKIVSWAWDFGDRTHSEEKNPAHRFTSPGDYLVNLTVTDDKGAKSSITKLISVKEVSHGKLEIIVAVIPLLVIVIFSLVLGVLFFSKKWKKDQKKHHHNRGLR